MNLELAVRRLVRATLADSWSGGGDPRDIPDIERALEDIPSIFIPDATSR